MVFDIRFSSEQFELALAHLLNQGGKRRGYQDEQLMFVLAAPSRSARGTRLVARELLLAQPEDFDHQSPGGLRPKGEFVARALTRCRQEGWSLVEAHSHPFDASNQTSFSGIDWGSDRGKMPAMSTMLPNAASHVTMVFGQSSFDAHFFNLDTRAIEPVERISVVGRRANGQLLEHFFSTGAKTSRAGVMVDERHDRQVRLFGEIAQQRLAESTVAVVGLGGLGSFAALELAHLGVGRLVLIDNDRVETTNLNRLIGARPNDVGRPKVDLYADLARGIAPTITTEVYGRSILEPDALFGAIGADLILGCVDSHGARLVLNHLAVQHRLPYVDAGTGVRLPGEGEAASSVRFGGQVQTVLPGLGCLECRGFIDPQRAAFDLAPPELQAYERERGYGTHAVAPAVVHLNGTVASVQVGVAVQLLAGDSLPAQPPLLLYNGANQSMVGAESQANPDCPTCSDDGLSALGDLSPLYQATMGRPPIPSSNERGH